MESGKLYSVYVLQNPLGRLYIGLREDPNRRLEQHIGGLTSSYLASPVPCITMRAMKVLFQAGRTGRVLVPAEKRFLVGDIHLHV